MIPTGDAPEQMLGGGSLRQLLGAPRNLGTVSVNCWSPGPVFYVFTTGPRPTRSFRKTRASLVCQDASWAPGGP